MSQADSPYSETIFTAAQIAVALGCSRQVVQRALAPVPERGKQLVRGNEARAWSLSSLPADMRSKLDRKARAMGCCDAEQLVSESTKRYSSPVPIQLLAPSVTARAAQLRTALNPALVRFHDLHVPIRQLATSGLQDFQRVFGYSVHERHWRRLFQRAIERDAGNQQWNRLDLYLDDCRRKTTTQNKATDIDTKSMETVLLQYGSKVSDLGNPTTKEKALLWQVAFEQMAQLVESGVTESKARKAARQILWKCGVRLAKNELSFFQLWRTYEARWRAAEGSFSALVDILTDAKEIELVWFLQYLSHQRGSLRRVAEELLAAFPKQPGTTDTYLDKMSDVLRELCLNPAKSPSAVTFPPSKNLYGVLQDYCNQVAVARLGGLVKTEIGKKVLDSLDYAGYQKSLVLIEGNARIGKSFVTKAWCEACPGKRRYVQAPSSNDMKVFFRAMAKTLGFAAGYTHKAQELRARISDVMQSGHLMLVIDEAHYLFPQTNVREALPNRINWMLTELVNFGVAVTLISTPQFTTSQRVIEKNTHWASGQLIGRMSRYTRLPARLDQDDLEAVARYHLPDGDNKSISALVAYAQASRKYLAGIDHATKAARYEAQLQGRKKVSFDDVKRAIATSVMPSDAALQEALAPKSLHQRVPYALA